MQKTPQNTNAPLKDVSSFILNLFMHKPRADDQLFTFLSNESWSDQYENEKPIMILFYLQPDTNLLL